MAHNFKYSALAKRLRPDQKAAVRAYLSSVKAQSGAINAFRAVVPSYEDLYDEQNDRQDGGVFWWLVAGLLVSVAFVACLCCACFSGVLFGGVMGFYVCKPPALVERVV